MDKIKTFLVEKDDSKVRLDKYLAYKLKNFTRTHIKRIILSENVHINDKIIPFPSQKLRIGDQIKLSIIENKKEHIKSQKIKIDIVYEDKDLIIVNKPSGMVVHPGAGNKDGTLVNGLLHLYNENLSNINGSSRPGIVHRIDKDTSGLIVVAKNNFSHAKLSEQFSRHTIKRKYIALIWGVVRPLNGRVTTLLSRNKKNRQLMSVSEVRGKKAITNYKTLKVYSSKEIPKISLVECLLETGRTHQIRVHMKFKGNQIVGDKKYKKKYKKIKNVKQEINNSILKLNRQFLHAKILGFNHPKSQKKLFFESNLPDDLKKIINLLEKPY